MPKLTIELVPKSCWYSNVRSQVSRAEWDAIRHEVYQEANYECEVCGENNAAMHAHEVWEYDDLTHTQRLKDLVCLCPDCHQVKHIGLASIQGKMEEAKEHLATVNGWNMKQATEYLASVHLEWQRRSAQNWLIDLSLLRTKYGIKEES